MDDNTTAFIATVADHVSNNHVQEAELPGLLAYARSSDGYLLRHQREQPRYVDD